jgi:hypothetical protein
MNLSGIVERCSGGIGPPLANRSPNLFCEVVLLLSQFDRPNIDLRLDVNAHTCS